MTCHFFLYFSGFTSFFSWLRLVFAQIVLFIHNRSIIFVLLSFFWFFFVFFGQDPVFFVFFGRDPVFFEILAAGPSGPKKFPGIQNVGGGWSEVVQGVGNRGNMGKRVFLLCTFKICTLKARARPFNSP